MSKVSVMGPKAQNKQLLWIKIEEHNTNIQFSDRWH